MGVLLLLLYFSLSGEREKILQRARGDVADLRAQVLHQCALVAGQNRRDVAVVRAQSAHPCNTRAVRRRPPPHRNPPVMLHG